MIASLKNRLFIVLIIQLVILAAFLLINRQPTSRPAELIFADLGESADAIARNVTQLTITENKSSGDNDTKSEQTLALNKTDQGWQREDGQAANDLKISGLIESLSRLKTQLPIATKQSAFERFEVGNDSFQKKVTLTTPSANKTLYLGESPAFKQSYARVEDSNDTYALAINSFELTTEANGWLDKNQLALAAVQTIEVPDGKLIKSNDRWQYQPANVAPASDTIVPNAGTSKLVAEEKVEALLDTLDSLRVTRFIEPAAVVAVDKRSQTFKLTVTNNGLPYTLAGFSHDERYYLSRSDRDGFYEISQSAFETLQGAATGNLTRDLPAPTSSSAPVSGVEEEAQGELTEALKEVSETQPSSDNNVEIEEASRTP